HAHAALTQAITDQLSKISHSSFLGLTNNLAPVLAKNLIDRVKSSTELARVFFSDDGSTAMETGLKMIWQFFQQNGETKRTRIFTLGSAYHGDTVGGMSIGKSSLFHKHYKSLLFETECLPSPNCYRCPYNKAKPQKQDARTYAKCHKECVSHFTEKVTQSPDENAAWILEPRVQGAAGFIMHPHGYLEETANIAQSTGAFVMLDEVMTGFGRTGKLFAYEHENCQPDLVALAKGMTGGHLPLAATLTTDRIFEGFRGSPERIFYHGHSYTGNQLGCAAAIKNLELLHTEPCISQHKALRDELSVVSQNFWKHSKVGDVRQEGLILAIELVKDFKTKEPFPSSQKIGFQVCETARKYGLLTRPVGDVLVLMPPYSTTVEELRQMADALLRSIYDILPDSP
ncbi:MAG: aminotransferase class III-fold pyridoxal phosphate-dependent enzyme, partial [Verrucomicrobiota bacterium]